MNLILNLTLLIHVVMYACVAIYDLKDYFVNALLDLLVYYLGKPHKLQHQVLMKILLNHNNFYAMCYTSIPKVMD